MERVQAVSCQIEVTPEQTAKVEATLQAFAACCNFIHQSLDAKLTNNVHIQAIVYTQIREKFGLSANLAVRAINRVAGHRKAAKQQGKPVKSFQPTCVDYDARIFSFREKDWTVSLTLVGGRERFKLLIGNYQIGLLKGQKPTSATLNKRKNGTYYLKIHLKSPPLDAIKTNKTKTKKFPQLERGCNPTGENINQQQNFKQNQVNCRLKLINKPKKLPEFIFIKNRFLTGINPQQKLLFLPQNHHLKPPLLCHQVFSTLKSKKICCLLINCCPVSQPKKSELKLFSFAKHNQELKYQTNSAKISQDSCPEKMQHTQTKSTIKKRKNPFINSDINPLNQQEKPLLKIPVLASLPLVSKLNPDRIVKQKNQPR